MQEAQTIQYYTLEEAKQIIKEEEKQKTEEKRIENIYFLKQKLSGLILVILGIIATLLTKGLICILFCVPLGLYLMNTKEKWMDF